MARKISRGQITAVVSGSLLLLTWVLIGRGQEEKRTTGAQPAKSAAGMTPLYIGVEACARCHNQTSPREGSKDSPSRCRLNEVGIWRDHDKHQDAYKVLEGKPARQMSKLLGYDVYKAAACLACHGVNVPDEQLDPSFKKQSEGVSCVVCHGPYDKWVEAHSPIAQVRKEKWQQLPRCKKETDYGMTDLWNAEKRTQLCISCHVGSRLEHKVVTHDMYAAGHPPLPSIEIATFGKQMPQHWESVGSKTERLKALHFDPAKDQFEITKLVAVSSVATLRETMKSLAIEAESCLHGSDGQAKALDLASFDCFACHHDLKSPSWRQKRYVGRPGRPQMRQWPTALVTVVLHQVSKNEAAIKELDDGLSKVYRAFSAQPFGDCRAIASAAHGVASQLERVTHDLNEAPYDAGTAQRMLRGLAALGEGEIPDYDTARQIAWAFQAVYDEVQPGKRDQDPKAKQIFDALSAELKLDLPKRAAPPNDKGNESIMKSLPDSLLKINDYDPDKFKEKWKKVAALVSSK